MIIWSGLGFLVALIGGGCLLAADALTRSMFGDEKYFAEHGWPKLAAFVLAGAITWFLGRYLHREAGKRFIDPQTNMEVVLKRRHSLFFIPVEYWGPIFVGLGVVFAVLK
jgi:hypothetical protein